MISPHTLPNPRSVVELWPDLSATDEEKRIEHLDRVACGNAAYANIGSDVCGRYDIAGKSIAVPFVGAAAAALVLSKILRLLHRTPAYTDIKFSSGALNGRCVQTSRCYGATDFC